MPKSTKLKSTKKRVNVKDLPAEKEQLTKKHMKKVVGGASKIKMPDIIVSSAKPKTGDGS